MGGAFVVVEHANGVQREPSFHRAQRANIILCTPESPQTFALSTAHDFTWLRASKV
jgi:hypothetical protein